MSLDSFLLCANWKMHKNPNEVKKYIRQISKLIPLKNQKKIVFLAPAVTLLVLQAECVAASFSWGAQNCHYEDYGSFTGENSPLVLKQMGATHCLVGHSERRQLFLENEYQIQQKIKALLKHAIKPILCVGENAEERKSGNSFTVIKKQLSLILQIKNLKEIYIAYEPLWAIGSTKPAEVEQISEMQQYIQQMCNNKKIYFLYGGSVNNENAKKLFQIPGVNGFLVGRASLEPQKFFQLYQESINE